MDLLDPTQMESVTVRPTTLAPLFKALAHPKRVAILEALRNGERCVCEIEASLDLRQSYVSQQLTVLREAGLVCYRKEGWNVLYRIARPEVYTLLEMATVIHGGLGSCALHDPDEEETGTPACCNSDTDK
jgi:DNA-binding transcriptional ArsR family regulator